MTGRMLALMVGLAMACAGLPGTGVVSARAQDARDERVTQAEAASRAMARATSLERGGQWEEARGVLEQHLAEYPASVPAIVMLAQLAGAAADQPGAESEASRRAYADFVPFAERAAEVTEWRNPVVLQVWIRGLAAAGRADSARAVARRWLEREPEQAAAYSALAEVEREAGRDGEAIDALREGRAAVGNSTLFAQELARLYAASGDLEAAAAEWASMLSWGDPGVSAVAAVLEGEALGTARTRTARAMLWSHVAEGAPIAVQRGAIRLALELGEPQRARALVESALESSAVLGSSTSPSSRGDSVALLGEFASHARERGFTSAAAWAAGRLAEIGADADGRRRWRAEAAELALAGGDTARARNAFEALVEEAPPGSAEYRTAQRSLFALEAVSDPERAAERLAAYAERYPEERAAVAGMAATLSRAQVRSGELEAAERALDLAPENLTDPAVHARLEAQRGLLALYEGRPAAAQAHLRAPAFIRGVEPERRTELIALAGALARADSTEAAVFGRWLGRLLRHGPDASAEDLLASWRETAASGARPALLGIAARALQREGRGEDAEALREALVAGHAESPEAVQALIELARSDLSADPGSARRRLQKLVVEQPRSALAPLARRLLDEMERRVPGA